MFLFCICILFSFWSACFACFCFISYSCFRFLIQILGSDACFKFLFQIPVSNSGLDSCFRFLFQIPVSDSCFRFFLQIPVSDSWFRLLFQIPVSDSCFKFMYQIFFWTFYSDSCLRFLLLIPVSDSCFWFLIPCSRFLFPRSCSKFLTQVIDSKSWFQDQVPNTCSRFLVPLIFRFFFLVSALGFQFLGSCFEPISVEALSLS